MSEKFSSFDMGKIMDEAFKMAQEFSEVFGKGIAEGFPSTEETQEKFRKQFKWQSCTDFYPHYSYPPANIYLTKDKRLIFEIALAGFEEKEIDLHFRGDYLYFSAKAPEAGLHEEGVQYFKRRLKLKSIEEQQYYVPEDKFDREKVQARFKNGLLRIVIPSTYELNQQKGVKVTIISEEQTGDVPNRQDESKPGV